MSRGQKPIKGMTEKQQALYSELVQEAGVPLAIRLVMFVGLGYSLFSLEWWATALYVLVCIGLSLAGFLIEVQNKYDEHAEEFR